MSKFKKKPEAEGRGELFADAIKTSSCKGGRGGLV
ncbi:hypothetical protein AVEN_234587-1, partial [Araneus ventricosus]